MSVDSQFLGSGFSLFPPFPGVIFPEFWVCFRDVLSVDTHTFPGFCLNPFPPILRRRPRVSISAHAGIRDPQAVILDRIHRL